MTEESTKQSSVHVGGNVDKSALIVGDNNQVNISDNSGASKTASELAIKRLRQEISELKSVKEGTKNAGCLAMMFPIGLIASVVISVFLAAVVFQMYDGSSGVGFVVIFTIAMFVIAGVIDVNSEKEAVQKRSEIDKQIAKKHDELQKHKNIVSS